MCKQMFVYFIGGPFDLTKRNFNDSPPFIKILAPVEVGTKEVDYVLYEKVCQITDDVVIYRFTKQDKWVEVAS